MNRRLRAALAAVASSVAAVSTVPAAPAAAHDAVCAGYGSVSLSSPVSWSSPGSASYLMKYQGPCTALFTGVLFYGETSAAHCGNGGGSGYAYESQWYGHHYTQLTAGGVWVLSGGVRAVLTLVPDVGEDCWSGADSFTVAGPIALAN